MPLGLRIASSAFRKGRRYPALRKAAPHGRQDGSLPLATSTPPSPLPSDRIHRMSPKSENARRLPSGDQVGHARPVVDRNTAIPEPSAFITKRVTEPSVQSVYEPWTQVVTREALPVGRPRGSEILLRGKSETIRRLDDLGAIRRGKIDVPREVEGGPVAHERDPRAVRRPGRLHLLPLSAHDGRPTGSIIDR